VDPYNDFMSEGGKYYDSTKKSAAEVGFYENMNKLVPAVRAIGIQVFIVPHHRWREGDYNGWKHMNPTQLRTNKLQGFAEGSWGGQFHPEYGPHEGSGDIIVAEHWGQSGFANTDLDALLKQRGIHRIIVVGMLANTCIESTARYGMELGYHVTVVRDATAAMSAEAMEAFETNAPTYAHAILTTEQLIAVLHPTPPPKVSSPVQEPAHETLTPAAGVA
jgi:nicotinamidase-related amidase